MEDEDWAKAVEEGHWEEEEDENNPNPVEVEGRDANNRVMTCSFLLLLENSKSKKIEIKSCRGCKSP